MKEYILTKIIRAALAAEPDVWVFRNEVAKMQRLSDGQIMPVGAGKGSADLLGCVAGIFCWWEVKPAKGRHHNKVVIEGQAQWQAMMKKKGAIGAEVTSVEEAMEVVERARARASWIPKQYRMTL